MVPSGIETVGRIGFQFRQQLIHITIQSTRKHQQHTPLTKAQVGIHNPESLLLYNMFIIYLYMHLKNAQLLTFKHLYILPRGERHPLFFYCKVDLKKIVTKK